MNTNVCPASHHNLSPTALVTTNNQPRDLAIHVKHVYRHIPQQMSIFSLHLPLSQPTLNVWQQIIFDLNNLLQTKCCFLTVLQSCFSPTFGYGAKLNWTGIWKIEAEPKCLKDFFARVGCLKLFTVHFLIFLFARSMGSFCPVSELNEALESVTFGDWLNKTVLCFVSKERPKGSRIWFEICIGSLILDDMKLTLSSRNRFVCEF